MDLKEQLLYVRTKLQLTQAELAKKTGISQTTIARWETKRKTPQAKSYGKFLAFCENEGIFSKNNFAYVVLGGVVL